MGSTCLKNVEFRKAEIQKNGLPISKNTSWYLQRTLESSWAEDRAGIRLVKTVENMFGGNDRVKKFSKIFVFFLDFCLACFPSFWAFFGLQTIFFEFWRSKSTQGLILDPNGEMFKKKWKINVSKLVKWFFFNYVIGFCY